MFQTIYHVLFMFPPRLTGVAAFYIFYTCFFCFSRQKFASGLQPLMNVLQRSTTAPSTLSESFTTDNRTKEKQTGAAETKRKCIGVKKALPSNTLHFDVQLNV